MGKTVGSYGTARRILEQPNGYAVGCAAFLTPCHTWHGWYLKEADRSLRSGGVRPPGARSPSDKLVLKPGAGNSSTRANNEAVYRPKKALQIWRVVSSSGREHVVPRPCVMTQPRRSSSRCGAPWKSGG